MAGTTPLLTIASSSNGGPFDNLGELHVAADGTFRDGTQRTVWLRGVNLCAKIPGAISPSSSTWGDSITNHRQVSFVNEPVPLEQVDEHLDRLRTWGLTLLRLGVTWEALEHDGP